MNIGWPCVIAGILAGTVSGAVAYMFGAEFRNAEIFAWVIFVVAEFLCLLSRAVKEQDQKLISSLRNLDNNVIGQGDHEENPDSSSNQNNDRRKR
jgi:hypothetical protein